MEKVAAIQDSANSKRSPSIACCWRQDRGSVSVKTPDALYYSMNLSTGSFDYAGPGDESICGLKAGQIKALGLRGFEERIHPDDRNRLACEFESDMEHEDIAPVIEYRLRGENGCYHWFRDSRDVIYADDGSPRAIAGILSAIIH